MKKAFLAASAALVVGLASCANPSDSGSGVRESWPQVTPVHFDVDLEGFEEVSKDPVYGVNWIFISKSAYEESADFNASSVKWRMKPVEFHKSNPNGLTFKTQGSVNTNFQMLPDEGAYRCVIYRKTGWTGYEFITGCDCVWVPTGETFKTDRLDIWGDTGTTELKNGEKFRKYYKYAW